MKRLLPLVVLAVLVAGCSSTPTSRIAANRAVYDRAPAEVQRKIAAGEIDVGFTSEQVKLALGNPDRRSTRTTPDGTSEVWSYGRREPKVGFGIGLGIGGGGGSTRVGTGIGISTGGGGRSYDDERLRVILDQDKVSAIERIEPR